LTAVTSPLDVVGDNWPLLIANGMNMDQFTKAILRPKAAAAYVGLSISSFYNRLNPESKYFDPKFPKPKKLGQRCCGFLQADLDNSLAHV
jgi:prophage regulatory protein